MYSRRTFMRAAGGAALAGMLAACRDEQAVTLTPDSTPPTPTSTSTPTDTASDTSGPITTTATMTTPTSGSAPAVSATPSSPAPSSSTAVAVPWSGADFAELDEFLSTTNGEAFAIAERGVIVHEWYRTDDTYERDIASAQKSVLSLLVGRATADGFFALDTLVDDVLGSGWAPHGQTSAVTVRHLLTMTSGLDDTLALVSPPGTAWLYSGAFAQLFSILATTTGRHIDDVASEWLFDPARADDAVFYERRIGEVAPIGMRATAKDLVAIGQVVLDGSQPGLPDDWLDESFAPSQQFNASYGYLWWLNGQQSFMLPGPAPPARPGSLIPTAPADLVAALGKSDQKLYVSRALGLVVARLGDKVDTDARPALSTFDAALWAILDGLRNGTR